MRTILALLSLVIGGMCLADGLVYTGCLHREKGILYFVREGTSPMHPCDEGDRVISFNQMGSPGPQGAAGPQGPPGPAGQGPQRFRFVGVTAAKFNGAGGWINMTRACAAQYTGSRMAFADEIRSTINPPDITAFAWININTVGGNDCLGWESASVSHSGAIVLPSGRIHAWDCTEFFAVACSAPEL